MRTTALIAAAAAALVVGAVVRASNSPASSVAAHHAPKPPIHTNAQLAARISAHDRAIGAAGPFQPMVHVACHPVKPTGSLAGRYDHRCRETYLGAICIVGSTPEVDILLVDVRGRTYRIYNDDTVDEGACSPP